MKKHRLVVRRFNSAVGDRVEKVYICTQCGRRRDAPYDFQGVDCISEEPNWEFVKDEENE